MNIDTSSFRLVFVGAWNPSILSPNWILRNLLQVAEGKEVPVEMEVSTVVGPPISFSMSGYRFTPTRDRLAIGLVSSDLKRVDELEALALKLMELLPHTPMGAVGFNFSVIDDAPGEQMLKIFDPMQSLGIENSQEIKVRELSVRNSIDIDGRSLNLTRSASNGVLKLRFNFHYDVKSPTEAISQIQNSFRSDIQIAQRIVKALYNEEIGIPDGETRGAN